MNLTNKKTILTIIGLITIIALVVLILDRRNTSDSVINIGFIGPQTGDLAVYGETEKNVTQIAVDEINKNGGINGKQIQVTYEDDQCMGKNALSAAQKLIDIDRIKILLVTCSQSVLPIAPITEKAHAIVFASYAASSEISDAGDYVFRNAYSNADISRVAAENVIQHHFKIAIISEITDYAADLRDNFKREFTQKGGIIVSEENFVAGVKDFRAPLTKIISAKPEAIFINPTSDATGIPLLKQLRELGYKGPLYGNFLGSGKNVQALAEAQGMIYFADPVAADSPLKADLLEKYKARYGVYPDYEYPAVARYDSIYILAQAIKNVGDDPTAIRDYLYQMPDFTGALGTYRFNDKGDITNVRPVVNQIVNGQAVKYNP